MWDVITRWYYSISMEQVFILTGICILLVGMTLGFIAEWIFRKESERGAEDGK